MRRRLRQWWRVAVAAAAILSPHAAAAGQPVHDIQVAVTRYAFEPATIEVTAGESVRLVIRSKDVVHGFSIPDLNIEARITADGEPVTVSWLASAAGFAFVRRSRSSQNSVLASPVFGRVSTTAG
jgi:heme/copper-type cytochrome/quinol oxidase subunit 2